MVTISFGWLLGKKIGQVKRADPRESQEGCARADVRNELFLNKLLKRGDRGRKKLQPCSLSYANHRIAQCLRYPKALRGSSQRIGLRILPSLLQGRNGLLLRFRAGVVWIRRAVYLRHCRKIQIFQALLSVFKRVPPASRRAFASPL